MGYYIQTNSNFGKAAEIASQHGAEILDHIPTWDEADGRAIVCVVENPLFEAAAYAYSPEELKVFANPSDHRPKTWLLMDRSKAEQLTSYKRRTTDTANTDTKLNTSQHIS